MIDRSRTSGHQSGKFLEWYVDDPLVAKNVYLTRPAEQKAIPDYAAAKELLPQPHWPANQRAVDGYWHAWKLAWKNLSKPLPGSNLVSNYIDTAFNDCLFMWDSAFIVQFGRYGSRAFNFQGTLDNLYCRQHPDGFICREIRVEDGSDQWQRHGPFSTGPNILAWAEWNYFSNFGDLQRLADVYAPLAAYHRWTHNYRTWQDGTYWTTGLGSGMDNMPRVIEGCDPAKEHAWMTWADATFQAILSAQILAKMAEILGVEDEIGAAKEAESLSIWANAHLWDEVAAFYFDRRRDGNLNPVKSVAGYWSLVAGVVPPERIDRFTAHLNDPRSFNRHHRVPSLSADASGYMPETGDYWCGAVWAPTTYMVLRGLTDVGKDDLAYEIAKNHHARVQEAYEKSGTFWENYSPEHTKPGDPAKPDFIGWSGLPPIAVFLEYVFGLRPVDPLKGKLLWDIRVTDEFGVDKYPLGPMASLSLHCAARASESEEPQVTVFSDAAVEVEVRWRTGSKVVRA